MTEHLDQLARHEQAIEKAQALEHRREQEAGERSRALTALRSERREYERAVGGGRERDADLARRFTTELNDLDLSINERGETIDGRARARVEGAAHERERAQQERDEFCSAHADELLAELAAQDDPEQAAAIAEHLAELDRLLRARERRVLRAHAVLRSAGRQPGELLADDPLDDLAFEAQRLRRADVASMLALPVPEQESAA